MGKPNITKFIHDARDNLKAEADELAAEAAECKSPREVGLLLFANRAQRAPERQRGVLMRSMKEYAESQMVDAPAEDVVSAAQAAETEATERALSAMGEAERIEAESKLRIEAAEAEASARVEAANKIAKDAEAVAAEAVKRAEVATAPPTKTE